MKLKCLMRKMLISALSVIMVVSLVPFVNAEENVLYNPKPLGHIIQTELGPQFVYNDPSLLISKKVQKTRSALPDSYDLRDIGLITSVKDQGYSGTCWSFSAIASIESNLIKQGLADRNIDLSERQLAWYTYNGENNDVDRSKYAGGDTFIGKTWDEYKTSLLPEDQETLEYILNESQIDKDDYAKYQTGGNLIKTIASLSRGYGAEDESKCKYGSVNVKGKEFVGVMGKPDTNTQTESDIQIKNATILPEPNGGQREDANQAIKQALVEYGAVSVTYYAEHPSSSNNYWNADTNSYYCEDYYNINHAVSIVGWDDNYSKDNFSTTPEDNGAWIIKNSYGESWGDEGYFYLSYYDHTISAPYVLAMEYSQYNPENPSHVYDNIYQYNGLGFGLGVDGQESKCQSANVFTARGWEELNALGVFTVVADTTVHLEVYVNPQEGNPTSGTKKLDKTVQISNAGYYTLDIGDAEIYLSPNEKYSVVISESFYYKDKEMFIISNEIQSDMGLDKIESEPGETYFSLGDSGEWYDVTALPSSMDNKLGGAWVKALTNNTEPQPDPILESLSITAKDSAGQEISTSNPYSIKGDVSNIELPQYTNIVRITANVNSIGTSSSMIKIGETEYTSDEDIPRTIFDAEDVHIITKSEQGKTRNYIVHFSVPATILEDKEYGVKITDNNSYLAQGTQIKVQEQTKGTAYESVKTELGKNKLSQSFKLYKLSTLESDGSEVELQGDKKVAITFPIPQGYDSNITELYYAGESGIDLERCGEMDTETLSVVTSNVNGLYTIAEKEQSMPKNEASEEANNTKVADDTATGDTEVFIVVAILIISAIMTVVLLIKNKERKGI